MKMYNEMSFLSRSGTLKTVYPRDRVRKPKRGQMLTCPRDKYDPIVLRNGNNMATAKKTCHHIKV
jgi:hypothetical protein